MRYAIQLMALLVVGIIPASADAPLFKVELFSHRVVKSLTVEAAHHQVDLCGSKADGPCQELAPGEKASCFAEGHVVCRTGATVRTFTVLNAHAPLAFFVAPNFDSAHAPPPPLVLSNVNLAAINGRLQAVTELDLESYVSGVLRGEASVMRTPAARQAMAILARTWALRWQGRHHAEGFDFCSLTHCQAFLPASGKQSDGSASIDVAAMATRGQVLLYHGRLADPYFTASCGGTTEAAGNVWPDRAEPYLSPIRDQYCLGSAHASWSELLSPEDLQQVLRESLRLPISSPLAGLSVDERDSSGRAKVLQVVAGSTWKVDANKFRYAVDRRLGWNRIKSNLYTIRHSGDAWEFSGHGMGHGVGLCQEGAEQMARRGSSALQILSTYFPGTEAGKPPAADPDPIASSEHFELAYPASQEPWVTHALDALEAWRKQLSTNAPSLPARVRLTTWASTSEFTDATGEPGWMAGTSDGKSIALQPLGLLARKHILDQTLRHELTHLVVHRLCAGDVPRWYEEGLVLYLTGERIEASTAAPSSTSSLEAAITHPKSEAGMKFAYAQALKRVEAFSQREGGAALWRALQNPSAQDLRWFRQQQ